MNLTENWILRFGISINTCLREPRKTKRRGWYHIETVNNGVIIILA